MESTYPGQFAVVTGASSGIGLELAKVFAKHGFDVLMTAEDSGLDNAAQQVRALDVSATTVQTDLTKPDGVERLYERIRSLGRPVDIIAINAGVGVGGPFVETDLERELDLIR